MTGTILLSDYSETVQRTDKLPLHDLVPTLYGLFGEVGSVMAAAKKYYRENDVYTGYAAALEEELGDAMWYLAAICRRLDIRLDEAFAGISDRDRIAIAATDLSAGPVAAVAINAIDPDLGVALLKLGEAAADLLVLAADRSSAPAKIRNFSRLYATVLQVTNQSFAGVLQANIAKVCGHRVIAVWSPKLP